MPTCKEGYRSKIIDEAMNGRTILQVVQEVHNRITGASGSIPVNEEIRDRGILWFYLNNWTERGSNDMIYDSLVKQLIQHVLKKTCEGD